MSARIFMAPLLLSGLLAGTGWADATTLSDVQGNVSILQNGQLSTGFSGEQLGAGDIVEAGDGGALIVYDDHCTVRVAPHASLAVHTEPPCGGGAESGTNTGLALLGGGAVVGGLVLGLSQHHNKPASN